ncbi:MAG: hypothetical protein QM704_05090 [Anaeromyxobacteraceae bacterium]
MPVIARAWLAAATVALALPLAAGAQQPKAPPPEFDSRTSGELLLTAGTSVLHGVGESAWGVRLGLGRMGIARRPWGGPGALGWLLTAAYQRGLRDGGAPVDEARLGLGVRARSGRFGAGADAELLRLSVDRASRPGALVATGAAVRLSGTFDLTEPDAPVAFVAALDVSLAGVGLFKSPSYEPSITAGLGLRF